ncbi:MAG: arsenosugar biosynthesis radical SAM (seleno)protein ArsS [Desulfurivibrio sp.]|nr:arsenosugar biosynthesis radical SAM (seleno)protein ArsS [Desulfurivibrio sp.]
MLCATATDINHPFPCRINRERLTTLQVNLGYRCNQLCQHCHVDAGPHRTEMMDATTIVMIPEVLRVRRLTTLDLTGGAPELHSGFRELVTAARELGVRVIDRCNLSILLEPEQEDLAAFLAAAGVEINASLPCYSEANVDQQRGEGVFGKSITALRRLNALGYGREGSDLLLNLVYNPGGPFLPGNQQSLEDAYRRQLWDNFGIVFNHLLVFTNVPINRFAATLAAEDRLDDYLRLLVENRVEDNCRRVMCRNLLSVDWRGRLYDCDFNQQLDLPLPEDAPTRLDELLNYDPVAHPVATGQHCYACIAGQGSSCGGAL